MHNELFIHSCLKSSNRTMSAKRNFFDAFRRNQESSTEGSIDSNENGAASNQPSTTRNGKTNDLEEKYCGYSYKSIFNQFILRWRWWRFI